MCLDVGVVSLAFLMMRESCLVGAVDDVFMLSTRTNGSTHVAHDASCLTFARAPPAVNGIGVEGAKVLAKALVVWWLAGWLGVYFG